MFVNVDMCKTVLIAGESTDSAAIFIELLKCFCEVLTIIFRMHQDVYLVTCHGHNQQGGGGRRGDLPNPFLKIEKKTAGLSLMCRR